VAEQIDRRNKLGSRAKLKRVTAKERRQSARRTLHRCLQEVRSVWDRHLEYELSYADLIGPAAREVYYGWDD